MPYIGGVLVFAQQGQMEEDGQRRGVGGQDDDFRNATVESLGRFVGTLLQLAVVRGLLDEVEDFLREGLVGDGPGGGLIGHFGGLCGVCEIGSSAAARQGSPELFVRVHGLVVIEEQSREVRGGLKFWRVKLLKILG